MFPAIYIYIYILAMLVLSSFHYFGLTAEVICIYMLEKMKRNCQKMSICMYVIFFLRKKVPSAFKKAIGLLHRHPSWECQHTNGSSNKRQSTLLLKELQSSMISGTFLSQHYMIFMKSLRLVLILWLEQSLPFST